MLASLVYGCFPLLAAGEDEVVALPRVAPLETAEAQHSFLVKDDFTLQLIAAEPLTTDPVAGAYDEDGRLFVVEMNDYPYTDKSTDKPSVERTTDLPIGKVRLLIDSDDDGLFDQSVIFARDLSWPTGIAVYDGGVFVAATPDLWYLKDTDGDNIADVRAKVFTGFRKFNVQAVVNNLIWGLDHRIYGAGGSNGGSIASTSDPQRQPVPMTRNDFRFDPVERSFELLSGGARFGNTFDDWGHRFICNIRNPIQHVLFPQQYLSRNPSLAVASAVSDVAAFGDQIRVWRSSPPEPWRVVNAQRLTLQGDPRMPRSEKQAAGFMTSACGITAYRGDAYPSKFREQIFIAEPSGNLVHRQQLTASGATFTSERIDQESEFIASTDNWFRPVNFVHAPDGTLNLLDMYRETIEHPWSMPDDLKAMLDLENGRDRGRIYRITPADFHRRSTPRLSRFSTSELVSLLDHPNVWHRETAHRLLFERKDPAAVEPLRKLGSTTLNPLTRLHVLWSLHGLGQLSAEPLLSALADSDPRVREHAIRLSEQFLTTPSGPKLSEAIERLADDPDAGVRFQAALTLGSLKSVRSVERLAAIARRDADDPWIVTAVLSSSADLAPGLLQSFLQDPEFCSQPNHLPLLKQLAQVVGTRQIAVEVSSVGDLLARLSVDDKQLGLILALDDGLRRKGARVDLAWKENPGATAMLQRHLSHAQEALLEAAVPLSNRVAAIKVLACQPLEGIEETFISLLEPRQPQELQVSVIRTLAGYHRDGLGPRLLAVFRSATPPVQYEIIEFLANHPARLPLLLDAIAEGKVAAAQVTPIRKTLLLNHADPAVRMRATQLIGLERQTSRQDVLREFRLTKAGDAMLGEKIYIRECAACHKLGQLGQEIGPSLATVRHRRTEEILTAILDPNREVGPNYMQYAVTLTDGRIVTGMIAEETSNSLTLRRANNLQDIVLRQDIAEIAGTGISLMPEGLEKKVTADEMADLIAFLRGK